MSDDIPLTRDKLYELIWNEPMTKVSARLGLSDVDLANICREADIPVPPRGYWAKKRSGQRVQRKRLPKIDEPIEFVFRPKVETVTPEPAMPEYEDDVCQLLATARAWPKIVPRTELVDLHPLVERTRLSLAKCKPNDNPRFNTDCLLHPEPLQGRLVLNVHLGTESIPRALLFLDALFSAIERIGGKLVDSKDAKEGLRLRLCGEDIGGFSLCENRRQAPNPRWKSDTWFESRIILVPGGMLTFASSTQFVGNEAHDTPTRKIEEAINRLVIQWVENVGRQRIAKVLSEKRAIEVAKQEGVRREREVQREALRREFQALQQAERQNVDRLTAEIARWQESQRLRSYSLALLERDAHRDAAIEPTDKVAQWAAWISSRADQLDPLVPSESSILDLSFEQYEQRQDKALGAEDGKREAEARLRS